MNYFRDISAVWWIAPLVRPGENMRIIEEGLL
jgi:hypothetical protein